MSKPGLDSIRETASPGDEPFPPALEEENDYIKQKNQEVITKLQIENDILKEDRDRIKSDNTQRNLVQERVWNLIWFWLGCVLLLTLFSGIEEGIPLCQKAGNELSCQNVKLHYESPVLVALISSPTVAIIGLAAIVLKYLFPSKDNK
ncbi:MAG: hypothetical protein WCK64_09750 [Synechococcaceae cyanobacterium ELA445]